jgi:hypothetical protein
MDAIDASVWVDAAVPAAFECLDSPAEHVKFAPSLRSLERVERLPDGRWHGEYGFRLSGVHLEGEIRTTSREPERALAYDLAGGIRGVVRYRFDAESGGCRIAASAECELPACVVAAVGDDVAGAYIESELERVLANAKARLEATRESGHSDRG